MIASYSLSGKGFSSSYYYSLTGKQSPEHDIEITNKGFVFAVHIRDTDCYCSVSLQYILEIRIAPTVVSFLQYILEIQIATAVSFLQYILEIQIATLVSFCSTY